MWSVPKAAEPLVSAFSIAFTRPTFQRVLVLMLGAILSLRQRTVTAMLRAAGPLAKGHWSDFHRVLCCRVWSTWPLGKVLAALVLELLPPDQPQLAETLAAARPADVDPSARVLRTVPDMRFEVGWHPVRKRQRLCGLPRPPRQQLHHARE
ncbi:MAG TPA: transposase [Phycisphaerae bacterium]|nr:transposase [Phycisphaerae bacterium]